LEGVSFQVSEGTRAEYALIIWHALGDDGQSAVVESSFRYNDQTLGEDTEPFTKEIASRSFNILQALRRTPLTDHWVDLSGHTKTTFVYEVKGNTPRTVLTLARAIQIRLHYDPTAFAPMQVECERRRMQLMRA
jgi:hypothetical protein